MIGITSQAIIGRIREHLADPCLGMHVKGLINDELFLHEMRVRSDDTGHLGPMLMAALCAGLVGIVIGWFAF